MADNKIIASALEYYQKYKWNIIPLYKDSKKPALEKGEFEGIFTQRLELDDLINRLKNPNVGNIGLSIGHTSNLWVIDFDDPSLIEKYNHVKSPLRQKTPSGGQHWFYLPVGDTIGNGLIETGVEYYTQKHNIVLAPSFVKAERNGRKYEGSYDWIEFGKPDLFPLSLLQSTTEDSHFNLSKYSRKEILALLDYLETHEQFVPGQHNDSLFYCSLIEAGHGRSEESILAKMLRYDHNDPTPQGDRVVKNIVSRAFEAASIKNKGIEIKDDVGKIGFSW